MVINPNRRPAEAHRRTYNINSADEVAALVTGEPHHLRPVLIEKYPPKHGDPRRYFQILPDFHPAYAPMQYTLLFPAGDDGYCRDLRAQTLEDGVTERGSITMRDFYRYVYVPHTVEKK